MDKLMNELSNALERTEYLRDLIKQRKDISRKIIKLMKKLYPVDCEIYFEKWGNKIHATVLEHDGFYERLFIKSDTGKKYWLDYSYLYEEDK